MMIGIMLVILGCSLYAHVDLVGQSSRLKYDLAQIMGQLQTMASESSLHMANLAKEKAEFNELLAVIEKILTEAQASWKQAEAKPEEPAPRVAAIARAVSTYSDAEMQAKVRPFVEAAKQYEMSGHQKRMRVILATLNMYPGTSVDAVEAAIEAVLRENA